MVIFPVQASAVNKKKERNKESIYFTFQIQRKDFFDLGIEFVSISGVKVFFPTCVIYKKDSGDEHKFCTILMKKTVGEIGILNSELISDQFFLQRQHCTKNKKNELYKKLPPFSKQTHVCIPTYIIRGE